MFGKVAVGDEQTNTLTDFIPFAFQKNAKEMILHFNEKQVSLMEKHAVPMHEEAVLPATSMCAIVARDNNGNQATCSEISKQRASDVSGN